MPLSNFVPRDFGFVHHSIAILQVPNPNLTIRNFFSSLYDLNPGRFPPHTRRSFHYYQHTDTSKKHVRIYFRKYYGDIYMVMMRKDKPPGFAIQAKNRFMGQIDEYLYVDACDVDAKTYVGLHGGKLYSQYSVYVEAYNDGRPIPFPQLELEPHVQCSGDFTKDVTEE